MLFSVVLSAHYLKEKLLRVYQNTPFLRTFSSLTLKILHWVQYQVSINNSLCKREKVEAQLNLRYLKRECYWWYNPKFLYLSKGKTWYFSLYTLGFYQNASKIIFCLSRTLFYRRFAIDGLISNSTFYPTFLIPNVCIKILFYIISNIRTLGSWTCQNP